MVALLLIGTMLGIAVIATVARDIRTEGVRPPTRSAATLNSYTLFAFDELQFKGGQSSDRGVVSGGNVGENNFANPYANTRLTMDDSTQLTANTFPREQRVQRVGHLRQRDRGRVHGEAAELRPDGSPRQSSPSPPAVRGLQPEDPFTAETNEKGVVMLPARTAT